jgi:hypothetical protein
MHYLSGMKAAYIIVLVAVAGSSETKKGVRFATQINSAIGRFSAAECDYTWWRERISK